MALVYPLALPLVPGFATVDFKIARRTSTARPGSGAVEALELADALWSVTAETAPMRRQDYIGVWRAFFDALREGAKTLLMHDAARPYPCTYPYGFGGLIVGGNPFTGVATLSSINGTALAIMGVPAGFKVLHGDYVGTPGTSPRLFRAVSAGIASSGGTIGFDVEPVPPQDIAGPVTFYRPSCVMRLVPGTASCPETVRRAPATFQAMQDLR